MLLVTAKTVFKNSFGFTAPFSFIHTTIFWDHPISEVIFRQYFA